MKKKKVLFLVKNYIGFGHIRRCLLIAKELIKEDSDLEILFISQAKSLNLFVENDFKVINFPYLEMLPTNALAAAYRILLNNIVEEIKPDLVLEDTYPDEWYINIPSLQNIPRLLILRRIDPISFDNYRVNGYFSLYQRIIVLEAFDEFCRDQIAESEIFLKYSGKFVFLGPVFHYPENNEIAQVQKKYLVSAHTPLIVVNAGAGGDHFNEAYCSRLFNNINDIAGDFLKRGISARFIFVTGPYFQDQKLQPNENVEVVKYEPNLPALLHLADIAIIRPGFNVLHEALSGKAAIVSVPSTSYMETQMIYTKDLCRKYGISIANIDSINNLAELIISLLKLRSTLQQSRPSPSPMPAQNAVAKAIISMFGVRKKNLRPSLYIALGNIHHEAFNFLINLKRELSPLDFVIDSEIHQLQHTELLRSISSIRDDAGGTEEMVFLQSPYQEYITPQWLKSIGVSVVFFKSNPVDSTFERKWYTRYGAIKHGILGIELEYFRPYSNFEDEFDFILERFFVVKNFAGVFIDVDYLIDEIMVFKFANRLKKTLAKRGIQLLSREEFIKVHTNEHFEGVYER